MRDYFCGWYLKCQNKKQTAAFIFAYHITSDQKSCSLQVITDQGSWSIPYSFDSYKNTDFCVQIGSSSFDESGLHLNVRTPELTAVGELSFGPLSPIRYDIMGPFKYVPFMECRHSVFSMHHSVTGSLEINGETFLFNCDDGYIEGDRGYSFPKDYLWTQCCFPEGSVMLSVADIPFCGFHFTGVISAIHYRGKEYRLATYLGARAIQIHDGEAVIKQGSKVLTVKRLEQKGHPLSAPVGGSMTRTIREAAACRAYYHYQENGKTVFEFESDRAAFEYEYPQ